LKLAFVWFLRYAIFGHWKSGKASSLTMPDQMAAFLSKKFIQ
jgi:hypothetical protein